MINDLLTLFGLTAGSRWNLFWGGIGSCLSEFAIGHRLAQAQLPRERLLPHRIAPRRGHALHHLSQAPSRPSRQPTGDGRGDSARPRRGHPSHVLTIGCTLAAAYVQWG